MIPLVKCLLCRHEDLGSNTRNYTIVLGMVSLLPSQCWEEETGRVLWDFVGQPAYPMDEYQAREKLCLIKQRLDSTCRVLWPPYIYVCAHACTYKRLRQAPVVQERQPHFWRLRCYVLCSCSFRTVRIDRACSLTEVQISKGTRETRGI